MAVITSFRPHKYGLEKFLSPIEVTVMLALWVGKKTARDIHRHITQEDNDYAMSTITTIIERLRRKGLITRRKIIRVYHYTPIHSTEEAFTSAAIREILVSLCEDYTEAVASFIAKGG